MPHKFLNLLTKAYGNFKDTHSIVGDNLGYGLYQHHPTNIIEAVFLSSHNPPSDYVQDELEIFVFRSSKMNGQT